MKKVRWFLVEEDDQTTGTFEVEANMTDNEINDMVWEIITEKVRGNSWFAEWEFVIK